MLKNASYFVTSWINGRIHFSLQEIVIGRFLALSYDSPGEIVSAWEVSLRMYHLNLLVRTQQETFSTYKGLANTLTP